MHLCWKTLASKLFVCMHHDFFHRLLVLDFQNESNPKAIIILI